MKIKGKVHCFFEQSGTFKNEFIKLGIPAEDYDIQNNSSWARNKTSDNYHSSKGQLITDQLSLLPLLDDASHPTWLLNGKPGIQNDCGVYVDNVFRFREGKLSGVIVEVNLCAEGNYIIFEFSYMTGTYGCGHPLCRPCHECHRNNSAEFLAECIYSVFKTVVHSDKNLTNYPKETKELLKLCKRACDRIAKEIK